MTLQPDAHYWVRRRSYTPWVVARAISEDEMSFGMVSGYDEDYEDTAFVKDIYAIAAEPLQPPTGVHANPQYEWADEPWQGPDYPATICSTLSLKVLGYMDYMCFGPPPSLESAPGQSAKWYRPANLEEPKPSAKPCS